MLSAVAGEDEILHIRHSMRYFMAVVSPILDFSISAKLPGQLGHSSDFIADVRFLQVW